VSEVGQTGSRPARAARVAERIVSLVPNLTEVLFAIGAGPQVVGVSNYDEFPPDVKSLPHVGALLDPDTERILTLRPDLVITYGSQADLESQFGRAGIRSYSYRHGGIQTIFKSIGELGMLTGHQDGAARLTRNLDAQLNAVRERVKALPRPRTLLVFGREPLTLRQLYVSGGVGFLHEMLEIAGGANVFGDVQRESVQPSREAVLMRAPEVILDVHVGLAPPQDTLQQERDAWSTLSSVPAVRRARIYLLYGDHLVVPGPRVGRATEEFARALHPEAFK
jgi:iron complex transport system substrate-binding protein